MFTLNMLAIAHRAGRAGSRLRGHRHQVPRALPLHRARDDRPRRSLALPVGRRRQVLLRRRSHGDGQRIRMRIRSMVGLIPLFAVETLEPDVLAGLDGFRRRMEWFLENRPDLTGNVASMHAARHGRTAAVVAGRRRPRAADPQRHARRARVPVAPTASARCRASTAITRSCCGSTATSTASTTSRRSRPTPSSAAIRTGADRSGSR